VVSGGVKEASAQYKTSRHSCEEPVPSEGGDGNPVAVDACPIGYKKTEVGVVPKTWQVKNIGSVLSIRHGKNQKEIEAIDGVYPILATGGEIGRTNTFLYDKPSVLIGRKGTINKPRFISTPFWTVDTLFYSEVKLGNIPKFVFYKFCLIDWMSYNEASGVPSLNASAIENIIQSFPDTEKEQTAIANALSNVDALITSLEKLITKKHAIKTAAMQQLLTGKKRLPPFDKTHTGYKQTELGEIPEDWEVLTVQDVASVKGGKRLPKGELLLNTPTKYPYIRVADMYVGGVDLSGIRYVPEHVAPIIKNYRIKSEDLFISVAGTLGIVGKVQEELDGANLTENADKITDIKADKDYLLYWLMTEKIQSEIESQSTVGAQPKLALGRIENFQIAFPNTTEEQVKISGVLTDMDKEIKALQQRLSKTQQIKQGMMQELLTGKTRLV